MKKVLFMIPAILLLQMEGTRLWSQSPTVTINQQVGQADPTSGSPIKFTATFSQDVTNFDQADISFTGSTTSGTLSAYVTGGPAVYTIEVSGMTSSGTVVASIPAGAANASTGGAPSLASTSSDNSVNYIKPAISCPANISVSTDPGYCGAIINNIDPVVTSSNASIKYTISSLSTYESGVGSVSGKRFFVGVNTVTYSLYYYPDVSCSFTITVVDNEPPVITCPVNLNFKCEEEVPPLYTTVVTATDNCSPTPDVTFVSEIRTNQTCFNRYILTRTFKATDLAGNTSTCSQIITVYDDEAPHFNQPPPPPVITVACPADIPPVFPGGFTAFDYCTPDEQEDLTPVTFREVKTDSSCPGKYTLQRTWTATDYCGNETIYTQIIHVNDTIGPEFNDPLPSPVSVSCESDIPAPELPVALDNCTGDTATITLTEVKSEEQCANKFKLTRTWIATDVCGNTSTRTQVIFVDDTEPPVLSGVSADTIVLWPPNHQMRDITINYTATDNCEVTSSLSVSSNEPVHGGGDGDLAPDWEIIDPHHLKLRAEKTNFGYARYYTVKVTATDGCNPPVTDSVIIVVAHNITGPTSGRPFKIGSTVSFTGEFWDKPGNNHTAKWLLDGNTAAKGFVTEPSGHQKGKVTGSYKFNGAGVYKLQMNIIDQEGLTSYANTNNDLDAIVVIYDPNGGNAYGGGWFQSPAGALAGDAAAEGKASYGFAVNYTNAARPKGETQFEFKVGSFEFNALNFDYLSIRGARAQFRGTGKIIGGQSGIGFIMTVKDGELDGSGTDKIRMKIYNRNTGYVYYDNQPGTSDADDPVTVVGPNSSVVIQGTAEAGTASETVNAEKETEVVKEDIGNKLKLVAYPNPSNNNFSLLTKSNDLKTRVMMQVFDQQGRLLEKKDNIIPGSVIRFGEKYRPGIYYVRIIQGTQFGELKLVKLSD